MTQKRSFRVIFFLVASIIACASILFIFRLDTSSKIISAGLGTILGMLTCGYIQLSNMQLTGDSNIDTNKRIERWLLPTVLGGIISARIVIKTLDLEMQNPINNFIFAWTTIFFAYLAMWFWRHSEGD